MTVLRNVWTDLVEKKLWPVAVVLLLALVAVPVVLGRGGGEDNAAAPAPAPTAGGTAAQLRTAGGSAGPQAAQVSLDTTLTEGEQHRKGAVRDPFKALHGGSGKAATTTAPAAPTPTPTPTATPSAGGGTGGTVDVTPSKDAPSTDTPAPATTPKPPAKPNPLDLYRVSIRFGEAGDLTTRKDIARLTPLPSSQFPFFVFLGVLQDKKTAVFLISSDVKATGDGTCRPSKTNCQTIELEGGDTEFFDYSPSGDDNDVKQFQMDVLSVHRKRASNGALAAAARRTTSRRGTAAYLAAKAARLVPQAARYRYSRSDGLLRRAQDRKARRAAAARVPRAVIKKTRWGTIVKANGAVAFAVKKARKAAHS